jgi:hypothetical protein
VDSGLKIGHSKLALADRFGRTCKKRHLVSFFASCCRRGDAKQGGVTVCLFIYSGRNSMTYLAIYMELYRDILTRDCRNQGEYARRSFWQITCTDSHGIKYYSSGRRDRHVANYPTARQSTCSSHKSDPLWCAFNLLKYQSCIEQVLFKTEMARGGCMVPESLSRDGRSRSAETLVSNPSCFQIDRVHGGQVTSLSTESRNLSNGR